MKKCKLGLLTLLVALSMSACGSDDIASAPDTKAANAFDPNARGKDNTNFVSAANDFISGIFDNKDENAVADATKYSNMFEQGFEKSRATMDMETKLAENTRNLNEHFESWNLVKWADADCSNPLTYGKDKASMQLEQIKLQTQYNNLVNNDKLAYQDKLNKQSAEQSASNQQNASQMLKKILPIIVVLVLAILLFMFLKNRRPRPIIQKAEAPSSSIVSSSSSSSSMDLNDSALQRQRSQLRSSLQSKGMDYDSVVSKYGDDIEGITRAQNELGGR